MENLFEKFYKELEEIIDYLDAEIQNEIYNIYLKYLENHSNDLKEAYKKGYEEGVNYTDGLISDERFPF